MAIAATAATTTATAAGAVMTVASAAAVVGAVSAVINSSSGSSGGARRSPGIKILDRGERHQLDIHCIQIGKQCHTLLQERGYTQTCLAMHNVIRVVL